ncbi:ABC-F family ATP-binding cassette domain-containing protein [Paroceanicella profunda]|uniref:ABC-F family ATP-binding cassette domain-containing protein n=1 Tax=Paroceanicella profunda TaxID=2579971 RepID=A0A5B8FHJ6_9RHOB|nr:ABC-F family ATP-binding cassette domain-containing protein [Paroceanicella profunda]QDL92511.1 ABC-F family ATP-binding cassette domain-containing protein [Paroceanicella profunda]
MLKITNLTVSIEGRRLLDSASATIPTGHKTGIVGRNGTGKTTLFKVITGELASDGGDIEVPRGSRIGGVRQEAEASSVSLLDTVLSADLERAALLAEAETATDPMRIAEIQTRLVDIDAHSAEARAASILDGLGFDYEAQKRACSEFSGGWRMRVALASVLFSSPDVLLLDEPTNYLDLEGAVWLESFIARYPHTALIISHDRGLLNRAVRSILHLSDQNITLYQGNYDTFDRERRARLEQQLSMKKKQDIQRAHIQSFVDRFRAKASKAKQAQSRLKMLERLQPINAVAESAVAGFSFPEAEELSPPIIAMETVSTGYDGTVILGGLSLRIDPDDRIALLGANGQGKSTLSKLIAGRLPPLGGTMTTSSKLRIGYFAQHQLDELVAEDSPLQHLARLRPHETPSRQRARLAAAGIGQDIVENAVSRLSGGQKARLAMFLCTIDAPHLLILDEPTNHLDIESREALIHALADYAGAVILVSHDPWLVEAVADQLWLVRGGKVARFDGDMDDYRSLLLSERGAGGVRDAGAQAERKANRPAKAEKAAQRRNLAPLRAEVRTCEDRVIKIEEMREKIDLMLSNPLFYEKNEPSKIEALQIKRGEIIDGLARAEALWLAAQERLEAAERG